MNYLQQYLQRGVDPSLYSYQRRPMPIMGEGPQVPTGTTPEEGPVAEAPTKKGGANKGGGPMGGFGGVAGGQAGGNSMNGMDWGRILGMVMKYFGGG